MSSCSWFGELVEMSMAPRNHYSWIRIHQTTRNNLRKHHQSFWEHIILGNPIICKIEHFGNDACRQILDIRLIRSWTSWIWDQYLSKNMKWKSLIFNSIKGIHPTHPLTHPIPIPTPASGPSTVVYHQAPPKVVSHSPTLHQPPPTN